MATTSARAMPELPPGWRISNSTGDFAGRPRAEDIDDGDSDDEAQGLDIQPDSPGWEDMEDDSEALDFKCLLCDDVSKSGPKMLDHCKTAHNFDFLAIRQQHNLDFYSTIKLINYIRLSVSNVGSTPDVSNPSAWAGDEFMHPTLENDALLFSLDELIDFGGEDGAPVADFDERQAISDASKQHTQLDGIDE